MERHSPNNLSERPFFENLNGLRFLGALLVFMFHCFTLNRGIWGSFFHSSSFQLVYKFAEKGHFGVSLFFVLSGFLIGFLISNELKTAGRIHVFHFFMRRVLRIWPLYFLLVVFGFVVFPLLPYGAKTLHDVRYYLFFLPNIDEIRVGLSDGVNFLTVLWSIGVEEQFYLTWIALMFIAPFVRTKRFFPLYLVVLILASLVFRAVYHSDEHVMYFHSLANVSDLALGALMGYGVCFFSIQRWVEGLKRRTIIAIYVLGGCVILGSSGIFQGVLRSVEQLVIGAFFAFVVLEQLAAKRSFLKMDAIPYFFKAGELTYGFYLFHCVFIYYWSIFFDHHHLTGSVWYFLLFIVLVFVSTYLTAVLSWRFFERPVLGMKRLFRGYHTLPR